MSSRYSTVDEALPGISSEVVLLTDKLNRARRAKRIRQERIDDLESRLSTQVHRFSHLQKYQGMMSLTDEEVRIQSANSRRERDDELRPLMRDPVFLGAFFEGKGNRVPHPFLYFIEERRGISPQEYAEAAEFTRRGPEEYDAPEFSVRLQQTLAYASNSVGDDGAKQYYPPVDTARLEPLFTRYVERGDLEGVAELAILITGDLPERIALLKEQKNFVAATELALVDGEAGLDGELFGEGMMYYKGKRDYTAAATLYLLAASPREVAAKVRWGKNLKTTLDEGRMLHVVITPQTAPDLGMLYTGLRLTLQTALDGGMLNDVLQEMHAIEASRGRLFDPAVMRGALGSELSRSLA
ncbi:hypothetical protein HYY73_02410 [Candidatus Woesearchaeota archaeon]|nr:hypothetical protein [Candidatus Woesearchaeota archaeon]